MRILGFDTATSSTSVALLDPEAGLELEARDDPPRGERPRHTTRLLALIVDLLQRTGTGWGEIDRIAVGLGPGTFTGLRVGVATARALNQSLGVALIGVSTLESLALNAQRLPRESPAPVALAVLDARRGEVFAAGWRLPVKGAGGVDGPGLALARPVPARGLSPARALSPGGLAELILELASPLLALGSGAVEFRTLLEPSGATIPVDDSELHRVSALSHCRLASPPDAAERAERILPNYLRLPDAELARRRRCAASRPQPPPADGSR